MIKCYTFSILGAALCILCQSFVTYGSSGKKSFQAHSSSKCHMKARSAQQNQPKLPASFTGPAATTSCTFPYGAPPNVNHDGSACTKSNEPPPVVSYVDRRSHAEARTLAFTVEHGLPLQLVPDLIKFAQEMATEPKVLQSMSMQRTTASYKLREGLGQSIHDSLVHKLALTYFSMNCDECTNSANQKVFSVLVCYFDEDQGESVTEIYMSSSLKKVSAAILIEEVTTKLKEDKLPLTRIISNLSDSANYMRGKTSGFETKLRELAPHLLDIDGDICHHVHNVVKKFCGFFGNWVERLCDDLYTEFKYGPDIREYAQDICTMLGVHYR